MADKLFSQRVSYPAPNDDATDYQWNKDVADELNMLPPTSTFSFTSPNSNVTAQEGTIGVNLNAAAIGLWFKQDTNGNTGWVRMDAPTRATPTSITKTTGGTATGTVTNVQTQLDGNVYQVVEAATTPGFDVRFNFTGLTFTPNSLYVRSWYDGTTTHNVTVELWDYTGSAWVALHQMVTSLTYITYEASFEPETRFVSSGAAIVRFNHVTGGNASHDVYWDYVSLQRSG